MFYFSLRENLKSAFYTTSNEFYSGLFYYNVCLMTSMCFLYFFYWTLQYNCFSPRQPYEIEVYINCRCSLHTLTNICIVQLYYCVEVTTDMVTYCLFIVTILLQFWGEMDHYNTRLRTLYCKLFSSCNSRNVLNGMTSCVCTISLPPH